MKPSARKILLKISVTTLFFLLLALPVILERISHAASTTEPAGSVESTALRSQSSISRFGFFLEETAASSGIDFTHRSPVLDPAFEHIMPQIASMGASVAVTDFDNDGWNDLYMTSSQFGAQNALYRNLGNGSFTDVAVSCAVADVNREGTGVSMGSVWADFDNDGDEDLFLYKWGKPELFRNEEGKEFTRVTDQSGLPGWINANTAIWLDYDSDGRVDLFIGGYFPADLDLWNIGRTDVLTESFEYSRNGGRNYLFRNMGNGRFEDVTEETGLTSTRWTLAAGAADLDLDGYPELIIANDYGTDEFYFNDRGQRFIERGSELAIGFSPKSGMNVTLGDAGNQGRPGIYISNITQRGILLQGNNFWAPLEEKGKISYRNLAGQYGIEDGGWSYGAQFGDLNNDGFLDLLVANGFISAIKGTSYWYDYTKVTGGNSAIISDIRNWPPMNGRSHSGYQQNRIWVNSGSGVFFDVASEMLDGGTYDSRAVAMADLWNRGTLDVVVANQNDRVLVYRNHVAPENNWIAFELRGTRSNRSAIGAQVRLHWSGQVQTQPVTGGIGYCSQNQRALHFGLGHSTRVERAEIIWPGGEVQNLVDPEIRKVHLVIEGSSQELRDGSTAKK